MVAPSPSTIDRFVRNALSSSPNHSSLCTFKILSIAYLKPGKMSARRVYCIISSFSSFSTVRIFAFASTSVAAVASAYAGTSPISIMHNPSLLHPYDAPPTNASGDAAFLSCVASSISRPRSRSPSTLDARIRILSKPPAMRNESVSSVASSCSSSTISSAFDDRSLPRPPPPPRSCRWPLAMNSLTSGLCTQDWSTSSTTVWMSLPPPDKRLPALFRIELS